MMVVEVETESRFEAGLPRVLFESIHGSGPNRNWDVASDGQRFVMVHPVSSERRQLNVVLNWFDELRRLVPTDN